MSNNKYNDVNRKHLERKINKNAKLSAYKLEPSSERKISKEYDSDQI
jgi:hypothetical protein